MLTAKREKFAQNVASGMTLTDAYRDAFNSKAKTKSLWEYGSRLMAVPEVQERVKELRDKIAAEAVMSAQERLEWLTNIVRNGEVATSDKLRAVDIMNKMDGEYVTKIQGDVAVRRKLEDIICKRQKN